MRNLFLIALLCCGSFSFAAKKEKPKVESTVEEVTPPEETPALAPTPTKAQVYRSLVTSRERRSVKNWGWVGQAGDFYFGDRAASVGGGFGFLWYVSPNDVLSVEFGGGGYIGTTSVISGDDVTGSNGRFGIFYKRFVTNSLYLKGGLEVRDINYKVTHKDLFTPDYVQKGYINLYTVWVGIGNQWEVNRHLTIGCDWIGASIPFASNNFQEDDNGSPFNQWDLKQRMVQVTANVGRFYIGMSF